MLRLIQSTAMAFAIAATAGAVTPVSANAQSLELQLGEDGPQLRMRDRDECNPRYEDCYGSERSMRREMRGVCTEDRALNKAERMGLDRVRIVSVGSRTIQVRGRTEDGDRARITFGRAPGCPILG